MTQSEWGTEKTPSIVELNLKIGEPGIEGTSEHSWQ